MLQLVVSQIHELAALEEQLQELRVRHARDALAAGVSSARTPASDEETRAVTREVLAHFRDEAWASLFEPTPDEPDAHAARTLAASRAIAASLVVLTHELLMDLPVVGCDTDLAP